MLTASQRKQITSDRVRRMMQCGECLAAELLERGFISSREKQELRRAIGGYEVERLRSHSRIRGTIFAAELANADRLVAARAVFDGLLSSDELSALYTMLKFQPSAARGDKYNELVSIIERTLEEA